MFELLWDSAEAFPGNTKLVQIKAAATARGVGMQTYEAGPGMVQSGTIESGSSTQAVTNLLIQACRDPRMYDVYSEYLSKAYDLGIATADSPWMAFAFTGVPSK